MLEGILIIHLLSSTLVSINKYLLSGFHTISGITRVVVVQVCKMQALLRLKIYWGMTVNKSTNTSFNVWWW